MRNFSILLVAAVGLFSNLAVADQTITRTYVGGLSLSMSQCIANYCIVRCTSVDRSSSFESRDPVYSSVMNLVQSATGAAGAAWSVSPGLAIPKEQRPNHEKSVNH